MLTYYVQRQLVVAGYCAWSCCAQLPAALLIKVQCAFCLLQQYSTIGHAFLSTFSMLIGGADLDLFYSSHNPVVGVILM